MMKTSSRQVRKCLIGLAGLQLVDYRFSGVDFVVGVILPYVAMRSEMTLRGLSVKRW